MSNPFQQEKSRTEWLHQHDVDQGAREDQQWDDGTTTQGPLAWSQSSVAMHQQDQPGQVWEAESMSEGGYLNPGWAHGYPGRAPAAQEAPMYPMHPGSLSNQQIPGTNGGQYHSLLDDSGYAYPCVESKLQQVLAVHTNSRTDHKELTVTKHRRMKPLM